MTTKLTLTIDQSIIEEAKKYAKIKEESLSNIVENYLKALVKEHADVDVRLSLIVKSL